MVQPSKFYNGARYRQILYITPRYFPQNIGKHSFVVQGSAKGKLYKDIKAGVIVDTIVIEMEHWPNYRFSNKPGLLNGYPYYFDTTISVNKFLPWNDFDTVTIPQQNITKVTGHDIKWGDNIPPLL